MKEERESYYTEVQADAKRIAAEHGPVLATRIEGGHPVQSVVHVAKEGGYDLMVMGPAGHVHGDDGGEGDAPRDL